MNIWDEQALAARQWWAEMVLHSRGENRATLARLRRARTPMDAFAEPATLSLIRRLRGKVNHDRAAVLASVLAHLKPESAGRTEPIGRSLGRAKFGDPDSAVLSEARFRRLLQAEDTELLDHFRRLIGLLKGRADPESIARTILFWNDNTRKTLIFDYYNVPFEAEDQRATPSPNPA